MNALVFGLTGAVLGGLFGVLSVDDSRLPDPKVGPLESRERADGAQIYSVEPRGELPDFLKDRVQPAVIEEFVETDFVSEDGTLHEPHKVYRIKRQAELLPKPLKKKPTQPEVQK